ncbi:MAG: LysR family transcriptional regulator [Candidatus Sericytochromatia bacterium]
MDRLEAMQIFLRVADLQSFTQAADSLNLPKATVSTAVQQLEKRVGTRLLNRTTRRVEITPEGQMFYTRCQDLLAELEATENLFQSSGAQITGKIRVDMNMPMARNLVIPRLPAFLAAHPGLEIELSSTDRRVDLLREGVDCVIRVGQAAETGLVVRELGQMQLVNCVSPAYLATHGRPQTLADLQHHQLVGYVQQFGARPEGFEYFDGERYREYPMPSVLTVNTTDAYQSACLAGLGIIQCPLAGVRDLLASGELEEVLPAWRAAPMPLSLVYPQRHLPSQRVRVFVAWLEPLVKAYLE